MNNIIKKGLLLLFLNLLIPTAGLSQIIFDSIEVKEIAIIFAEHEKYSIENPLLKREIKSLEDLNQLYVESDSIQRIEIETYKDKVESDSVIIKNLESSKRTMFNCSMVGGILLFILGLLL